MPKRKHKSVADEISHLQKKIRRLAHKMEVQTTDSETESNLTEVLQDDTTGTSVIQPGEWFIEGPEIEVTTEEHVETMDAVEPTPPPQPGPSNVSCTPVIETIQVNAATLDQDVMDILGIDPSKTIIHGPDLHAELASRLTHISTQGLGKELCKETTDRYPIPSNCVTIGAPMLNLEIKAALPEQAITRDKGIEFQQKQLAAAISCLGNVINKNFNSQNKNTEELQKLVDACRILCNIQHSESTLRRNLIINTVKNDMKEHLKNTKIDSYLFGENLTETLKCAKAVNRSGAELKRFQNKSTPGRYRQTGPSTLNRRAPPQTRRPLGQAPLPTAAARSRAPSAPRLRPPPPPPARSSNVSQPTYPRRRY